MTCYLECDCCKVWTIMYSMQCSLHTGLWLHILRVHYLWFMLVTLGDLMLILFICTFCMSNNSCPYCLLLLLVILYNLCFFLYTSAHLEWNLDGLLDKVWEYLNLTRIYTKPKGMNPDYEDPVILSSKKRTVEDFCERIHKDMLKQFK
jgi:hypothetical protein